MSLAKKVAAEKAVDWIKEGMSVGLGTGSTAYFMLQKLGERVKEGLHIRAAATSKKTEEIATELGIELIPPSSELLLDVTIDGADEINPQLSLIKGGGGALFREKMIASVSRKLIIIADDSKYVEYLGSFPLPVEIVPFGWEITKKRIDHLGGRSSLRKTNGQIFLTDNQNYILDCSFEKIEQPSDLHHSLKSIPGVVETGLFIEMASMAILGKENGTTHLILLDDAN